MFYEVFSSNFPPLIVSIDLALECCIVAMSIEFYILSCQKKLKKEDRYVEGRGESCGG
ncbi:hypothetical protein TanjilG_14679 [Lupinus angustifolius]|uniref:Uncharacterized protein n=1 Tax=Lupinus angustifolius TaxID=3871 RepID=A0A1J7GSM5_LUPAN|nr:hypothetical protein TanjilG_14679 [Lupinus angustifolius]